MKKQTTVIFYFLSAYILLQFIWWGFHLIQLSQNTANTDEQVNRRVLMILGEGSVFILILLLGLYKIRSAIKKEFELSGRQSNFLLSITHELKTPIASSKLLLQTLLKRELIQEKRNELITKTLNENERLENLIDNILNASRVENNALQAVKTEINLAELSIKIINRLSLKSVSSEIQANTIVKGDVFMLETIIENLIENAVKYSGTNPCITLYSFQNEKEIVFGVKDQGPGIPLTERENIFTKFYRIGNEETRSAKGSGLGLFIVSEFVRLNGGSIQYKENLPKGAAFEVTLPL